jgi:hypothetical protein
MKNLKLTERVLFFVGGWMGVKSFLRNFLAQSKKNRMGGLVDVKPLYV